MEIWGICTDFLQQDDIYRIYLKTDEGTIYQVSVQDMDVHEKPEIGRHYYAKGDDATETMKKPAIFADYVDRWGRYCDHCGKHHTEGYYVNEDMYACSDECGYALCGGEKQFRETIWLDEDGELDENSPTYWTEWEC